MKLSHQVNQWMIGCLKGLGFFYIFSSSAFIYLCRTCMQLEKSSGGLMRPNSSWSWETGAWLTFAWVRAAPREIITTVRHPGIPAVTSSLSGVGGTLNAQDQGMMRRRSTIVYKNHQPTTDPSLSDTQPPQNPRIGTMNICCKFNCKKWKKLVTLALLNLHFLLKTQLKISHWPWDT